MAKKAYTVIVVGPGAIGCLFGGIIREAGHEVVMLDHEPLRAEKIDRDGIRIEGISGNRTIKVRATARPVELPDSDLVIIATKSYDTEKAILDVAGAVGPNTPVLTLQNGLGNVEMISRTVGSDKTIGGITSQGATLVGPGSIIHAGTGKTVIGTPANRPTAYLEKTKAILESAGFEPQISFNLEATIWGKLIINVGINALTAILRVHNGRLLDFEGSRRIMRQAVEEAVAVCRAKNIQPAHENPLAQVEEVCRLTARNVSSMLQDVVAKRRTEIDAINGAVAWLGGGVGIDTPTNELLTLLVHAIEQSYDVRLNQ
ncbi:MAG: 2-dehydropantoate 2-reductase [Candidatus Abyssobacteria bacterium SURF_5]|uniref:2-dehydropantoate 2-reductase n=1 Tax=Abyssobacteria bacterium (strain SURF_5) TaxID=2093360 RepID=A0A3A4NXS3_ABYX5|nr:MAG: 2-dehydropantoate 2-reductase [Candidatus Abyssubacteria bacterium SURF_5]